MAKSSRPPTAPRQQRSWRPEAAAPMTPLARRVRLVLATVVVVLLAAAMIYALRVPYEPQTHTLFATLIEHKELTAPPWAKTFVSPDELKQLETLTRQTPEEIGTEDQNFLPDLRNQLGKSVSRPEDRLLALIGGQGVSRVDRNMSKPYLLLSNFDPSVPGEGYLPVESLLADIQDCQASVKLLVIDAGNMVYDPRIGMLANEFPRLLEEAVKSLPTDSKLWVLLSHGTWEISHLSLQMKRSIFGYYVSQGLQGEANRKSAGNEGDRAVDLRELYDYVHYGVSEWVKTAHGSSQHPILLKGGKGRIRSLREIDEHIVLVDLPEEELQKKEQTPPKSGAAPNTPAPTTHLHNRRQRELATVLAVGMPLVLAQADQIPAPAAQPAATPAATPNTSPMPPASAPSAAAPAASTADGAPAAPPVTSSTPPSTAPPGTEVPPATATPAAPPTDAKSPTDTEKNAEPTKTKPAIPQPALTPDLASFVTAWELRDRIEQEARADVTRAGSPADFAPHLWREYQERLLHYELMLRCGEDPGIIDRKLTDNILLLNAVTARIAKGEPLRTSGSLVANLAAELKAYRELEQTPREAFVVRGLATRDDLLVQLPYIVRWYAMTSLVCPGEQPSVDRIRKLIAEVASLSRMLDAPRLDSTLRYERSTVDDMVERVVAARDLVLEAAPEPGDNPSISAVECYLSTALPGAKARAELLKWLETQKREREKLRVNELAIQFPKNPPQLDEPIKLGDESTPERWKRIHELAQLELGVAELVDPGSELLSSDDDLARRLAALQQVVGETLTTAASSQESEWRFCRDVGTALEGFYAEIATQIATRSRALAKKLENDPAAVDSRIRTGIERLYQLLDARDADTPNLGKLVPFLAATSLDPVTTDVSFEFTPTGSLALEAGQRKTAFELVTKVLSGRASDAWVTLNYDQSLLELEVIQGDPLVNRPESDPKEVSQLPRTFSLVSSPQVLSFQVSASPEVRRRLKAGDTVLVQAALYYRDADGRIRGPEERSMQVVPALPLVELLVGGPKKDGSAANAPKLLRPFPNKETAYQLQVFNRSEDEPQEVTVQVFAVPAELGSAFPKRWPFDEAGQQVQSGSGLKPIATGTCIVPPQQSAPVVFKKAEQAAPPGATAAPAAAADAATSAEPPPPSIDYGLVCLLEDKKGRRSVVNLEIEPKPPSEYLKVSVGWDEVKPKQVKVDVRSSGSGGAGMPPGMCVVRWKGLDELFPGKAKKDNAELGPPDYAGTLFTDVPTDQAAPVEVWLDVDGFPRAMAYGLPVSSNVIRDLRSVSRVRIIKPANNSVLRAPLAEIPLQFEVDVPADAFKKREGDAIVDVLEIGLVDATKPDLPPLGKTKTYHTDRQAFFFLAGASEDGTLTIKTLVKDFDDSLPTDGLKDQPVGIVAVFKRGRTLAVKEQCVVYLDATPPQVTAVGQLPAGTTGEVQVEKGTEANVFAVVDDEGGVQKVEFFVVKPSFDVDKDWQNGEKLTPDLAIEGARDTKENRWVASIPTSDFKGEHWKLLVRATDRVDLQGKHDVPFEVKIPTTTGANGKPAPMLYDLRGKVVGDGISGLSVKLEQPKRTVSAQPNVPFVFKGLPAGEYTLTVEATVRNIIQPPKLVSVTLPQDDPPIIIDFGS